MAFELSKKEFVERLLHTPVKSFEISEGCKIGDNVAGSLKSIKATTESGQTISAVYKFFPAKESPHYQHIKEGQVFRTECDAYTVLAKTVEDLVNSRRVPQEGGPYTLPIPAIYDHFNDDENDYICLEDVRPQGFKMPNVFSGLTYPETSLILQELASFHAYTYAVIRNHGEKLFLPTGALNRFNFGGASKEESLKAWFAMISGCVQNSIEIMEKVNPSLAQKMKEEIPEEKAGFYMGSCIKLTDTQLFPCLVHGDFWSNNVLIKYDTTNASGSERRPVAVKFVDFQFTRRGNIFEDLVYFLFTSTDTEFREKYLTRVLMDYYDSFKSSLSSINFPMPINFTPGFLIDTFNSLMKGGLVHLCFAIPMQLGKPSEAGQAGPEQKNEPKENSANEVALSEAEQAAMFQKMFQLSLRQMVENSPPALKRLEEVTKEVLISGKYS